jgi:hypothetical protein
MMNEDIITNSDGVKVTEIDAEVIQQAINIIMAEKNRFRMYDCGFPNLPPPLFPSAM